MSLQYSELEWEKNVKNSPKFRRKMGSTRKNNAKTKQITDKVKNFLNAIQDTKNEELEGFGSLDESEDDLANFAPPKPELTKMPPDVTDITDEKDSMKDNPLELQDFQGLNNDLANNLYYKQHIPYFTKTNNTADLNGPQDSLIEKLNYVINMMEDQNDIKNNKTSEELVLYLFLGVFVIFVVDSFARAGKYTR